MTASGATPGVPGLRDTPPTPGPLASDRPVPEPAVDAAPRRFRPELQGLRALAVVLVVIYHVLARAGLRWRGRLLRHLRLPTGRADDAGRGVMHRGPRRLLGQNRQTAARPDVHRARRRRAGLAGAPPAVAMAADDPARPLGSGLFFQNWRLAADSVDYYAAHNTASVVQHLWSLSIQGQFYIAFPLVVVVAAAIARRAGRDVRGAVTLALVALSLGSLACSVTLSSLDQRLAYFHSGTRLWEFTLGGLLAGDLTGSESPGSRGSSWAGPGCWASCSAVWSSTSRAGSPATSPCGRCCAPSRSSWRVRPGTASAPTGSVLTVDAVPRQHQLPAVPVALGLSGSSRSS